MRKADYPIDPLFIRRWSPRAMSGEPVSKEELMTLFEAARFAPSSYNGQPWRFVYALKDTPNWQPFFDLLVEFNQSWAKNAAALVVVLSRKNFEYNNEPARTHSFDAGAAWMSVALQATISGLVVHGMEGFDYKLAAELTGARKEYEVEAMFAVGQPGRKEDLPLELQEREEITDRRPLDEIVFEGSL